MDDERVVDPELQRIYDEQARAANADIGLEELPPYREEAPPQGRHKGWKEASQRRLDVILALRGGMHVRQACEHVGVAYDTYLSWRHRYPQFAAKADEAKMISQAGKPEGWDGTPAQFTAKYFKMVPTWFQLLAMAEMANMQRGNILMCLWFPESGKTTTFENHASKQLALDPNWRNITVSESQAIARKILGRVMARMSPMGPFPGYVDAYGPFEPQIGAGGRRTQPWSDIRFRVFKASHSDERDYSMLAVGGGSKNIVSTRTDHAHVDDIQSMTTINRTDKLVEWFRQDLLSRPGEDGITTIFGTRVNDNDFYEKLLDDPELDTSVMKVLRFPAIITDNLTNEVKSIWPEKWPLEKLDRQRRKVGPDPWDRNYMQSPGLTTKGRGTFNKDDVEPCKNPHYSLQRQPEAGSMIYVGLDPSIGGKNAVMCMEPTPDGRLVVRRVVQEFDLKTNAQIIKSVSDAIDWCSLRGARCTDLVIEAMAFQKGLMHDEELIKLRKRTGISTRDHLTGWNKYDPDIGIPSMAVDFRNRDIVLPWSEDQYTREITSELVRQLYKWKPFVKGNKLRQDLVMVLWFCWIVWRERYKKPPEDVKTKSFATRALPWSPTATGLLVPTR